MPDRPDIPDSPLSPSSSPSPPPSPPNDTTSSRTPSPPVSARSHSPRCRSRSRSGPSTLSTPSPHSSSSLSPSPNTPSPSYPSLNEILDASSRRGSRQSSPSSSSTARTPPSPVISQKPRFDDHASSSSSSSDKTEALTLKPVEPNPTSPRPTQPPKFKSKSYLTRIDKYHPYSSIIPSPLRYQIGPPSSRTPSLSPPSPPHTQARSRSRTQAQVRSRASGSPLPEPPSRGESLIHSFERTATGVKEKEGKGEEPDWKITPPSSWTSFHIREEQEDDEEAEESTARTGSSSDDELDRVDVEGDLGGGDGGSSSQQSNKPTSRNRSREDRNHTDDETGRFQGSPTPVGTFETKRNITPPRASAALQEALGEVADPSIPTRRRLPSPPRSAASALLGSTESNAPLKNRSPPADHIITEFVLPRTPSQSALGSGHLSPPSSPPIGKPSPTSRDTPKTSATRRADLRFSIGKRHVSVVHGSEIRAGEILLTADPLYPVLYNALQDTHCAGCFMDAEAIATERNCSLHVAGGMLLACQHCEVNVYCSARCYAKSATRHYNECRALQRNGTVPSAEVRMIASILWDRQYDRDVIPTLHLPPVEHYELLELGKILFDIKRFVGKRQPNGAYRLDYEKYHLLEESEMVDLIRRIRACTFAVTDITLRPLGCCISPQAARFGHSCSPNAVITFPLGPHVPKSLRAVALDGISDSKEITISYISQGAPIHMRQGLLRRHGFIHAGCKHCGTETSHGQPDVRWASKHPGCSLDGIVALYNSHELEPDAAAPYSLCTACGEECAVDTHSTPLDEVYKALEDSWDAEVEGSAMLAGDRRGHEKELLDLDTQLKKLTRYFPLTLHRLPELHRRNARLITLLRSPPPGQDELSLAIAHYSQALTGLADVYPASHPFVCAVKLERLEAHVVQVRDLWGKARSHVHVRDTRMERHDPENGQQGRASEGFAIERYPGRYPGCGEDDGQEISPSNRQTFWETDTDRDEDTEEGERKPKKVRDKRSGEDAATTLVSTRGVVDRGKLEKWWKDMMEVEHKLVWAQASLADTQRAIDGLGAGGEGMMVVWRRLERGLGNVVSGFAGMD